MRTPAPSWLSRGAVTLTALLALALPAMTTGQPVTTPASMADGWIPFEGSWSAAGHHRTLRVGGLETGTFHLSGTFAVAKGEGFRKGFRAEAIGYEDGAGSGAGSMVLTDDRGDQVYCRLKGAASKRSQLIVATITGGSGSYAGLAGDFSFEWRYLTKVENGQIQGFAVDLKGRYRRPGPAPAAAAEVTR
jgi:hypothetical protein